MTQQFSVTIAGAQRVANTYFDVINPATGDVAGQAPTATAELLEEAVNSAQTAFLEWSAFTEADRQQALLAIADKVEEYAEELATLLTKEQGKPLGGMGSRWELEKSVAWLRFTSKLSLPVEVLQDNEAGRVELHRKPLGVVGSITPWNFPVLIAIWHIAPALLAGNTVIIKPSPYTPLTTLRLIELISEVLPEGVVNALSSPDDGEFNVGAAMSEHDGIRKIIFTGSCGTGQKIMASAAPTMKRLTLEMGGNDAAILCADADLEGIGPKLFWGAFINNGQTCGSLKRLYVHEDIHDKVVAELVAFADTITVGDGMADGNMLGPIQNQMQFDKVSRLVAAASKSGKVETGGAPGEGLFYPPTIITGMSNNDPLVREEQFGPALPIIKFSDADDVIAMANDSENGLGGSVWSQDLDKARAIAAQLECGTVWINKHAALQPNAPFGGVKKSGLGVEFGDEGLKAYTDIQVVLS